MDLTRIIHTNFSNAQLVWIIVSIISGLISIFLFLKQKTNYSLFFLFLSGTILRFFAADLDHFLYTWDEQYHALVAKNMITNPFKPMLIVNPVLDYDPHNWISNHIWLHKQPWFLWQIALFFKLFGVSELVLRTPSAIMFSILVLVIYRIGSLVSTKRVAWFGAFLYTFSFYFLNIVTGMQFTDHNDVAFIFYITLSIWAWLEYIRCRKKKWVVAIGIFVGIAILNKWLVGLLVYSGWIISALINSVKGERIKEFKNVGIALALTILIALPWQVYIFLAFPLESKIEFALNNSRHILDAVEGHSGPRWYHFYLLSTQYGGFLVYFVILPGLFYLLKSVRKPAIKTAFITFLIVTFSFFTIVQTKMPLYCAIVSPIIFLALGAFLDKVIQKIQEWVPSRYSNWVILPFLGILLYMNLDINKVDVWHSSRNEFWHVQNMNAIIDKEITPRTVPGMVIFNSGYQNAAMLMFYSGSTAYCHYPDAGQYKQLKRRNIKMATFAGKNIPSYLADDPSVVKFYMLPINAPLSTKNP